MSENNGGNTGDFRDVQGRFLPGNPGKPIGAKSKTPRAVLQKIEAMEAGAVQKLWEGVCLGEQWAVEFVLKKLLPADRTIALENFDTSNLKDAIIAGDVSPAEAKTLAAVLKNLNEIESLDAIKTRLEELEQAVSSDE